MRINKEKGRKFVQGKNLEEYPVDRGKELNDLTLKKTELERLELAYSWFQERVNGQKVVYCFKTE